MFELDRALFLVFHGLRQHEAFVPGLRSLFWFLNHHALDGFLYVFLLLSLSRSMRRRAFDGVLVFFLSGHAIEVWIKPWCTRPRPSFDPALRTMVHVLGRAPSATSFSFPSGSAFVAAASATWLWAEFAREHRIGFLRTMAVVFALAIGVARVVAGYHYPSDIVVGWILGVLFARTMTKFLGTQSTAKQS